MPELEQRKVRVVALDTEATSLRYAFQQFILGCTVWEDGYETTWWEVPGLQHYLYDLSEDVILVGHNLKFDLKVLRINASKLRCRLFDTLIASWLCNENGQHGLKHLSERLLGNKLNDPIKVRDGRAYWGNYDTPIECGPPKEIRDYCLEDTRASLELYKIYSEALENNKMIDWYWEVEEPFLRCLTDQEQLPITIDEGRRQLLAERLELSITGSANSIYKQCGYKFNLNSHKQLSKVLFETAWEDRERGVVGKYKNGKDKLGWLPLERRGFGLHSRKTTDTGQAATDSDSLRELADHPVIDMLLHYKELQKIYSTYVEALPKSMVILNDMQRVSEDSDKKTKKLLWKPMSLGGDTQTSETRQVSVDSGRRLYQCFSSPSPECEQEREGYGTSSSFRNELGEVFDERRTCSSCERASKRQSTGESMCASGSDSPSYNECSVGGKQLNGRYVLFGSFNRCGTVTGRLSSNSPNLQNIPIRTELGKEVRSLFIPESGRYLVVGDLSQIEYRLLAHFSQEPVLLEAFDDGTDIHIATVRAILGPDTPDIESLRGLGKTLNYAVVYGAGSTKIAKVLRASGFEFSTKDCRNFLSRYKEALPNVLSWKERVLAVASRSGYVKTVAGRYRRLPELRSRNIPLRGRAERQAINSVIQGSAADVLQAAAVSLYTHSGLVPILQVHDELVFEVPEDKAERVAMVVKEWMEANPFEVSVPIEADLKIVTSWGLAK